jgi:GntR family transcriptional regulator
MIRFGDHASVPRDHELPSERVYREIRERIISGDYQPGSQLPTVGELAESFSVSRATVVKAMKQLQADGYVVSRARWASFVSDNPPKA